MVDADKVHKLFWIAQYNYMMEKMFVIFTPQQDRSILYTIGELVSFNRLLYSTTNQKPYAGTSVLYK